MLGFVTGILVKGIEIAAELHQWQALAMKMLEAYYPLIGKVVVQFQNLDFWVNVLFVSLLSEDPNVTMAFMVTLSFSKKLDALSAVVRLKITREDLLKRLGDVLQSLSDAEASRNKIVHAASFDSASGEKVFFHKPKATRKGGMKNGGVSHSSPEDIEYAIKSIQAAMTELFLLGRELKKCGFIKISTFDSLDAKS